MAELPDWPYWKVVSITGQTGAGTDYQVELTIGDSAGGDFHLEGHCTNFPQDIRITDDDGTTLLDHWVEDITADPIVMHIEVKDDLGSNSDIRIYYGKSGETTASNGANTFIQWHGSASSNFTDSSIISTEAIYEAKARVTGTTDNVFYGFTNVDDADHLIRTRSSNNLRYGYAYDGVSGVYWSETPKFVENQWHKLKIVMTSATTWAYVDDNEIGSGGGSGHFPTDAVGIHMNIISGGGEQEWSFARKYNSPEPAFSSVGEEQSLIIYETVEIDIGGTFAKIAEFTLASTQSLTESSNLSVSSKFILESLASGTYIPTANLLILLADINVSSVSLSTLSKILISQLVSSFQSSILPSFILKEDTWTSDSDIVDGLVDVGYNSAPCVFLDGSTLKLITGEHTPDWTGYYWSGSAWVSDSDVIAGLADTGSEYSSCTVFLDGSTLKLITGEHDGTFDGYYWSGSTWTSDSSIVAGLIDVGARSAPTVFDDDGTLKMIIGETDGVFNGYYWNVDTWTADSDIVAGLVDTGSYSNCTVFYESDTWRCIVGRYDGLFDSYYWNVDTWTANSLDDGLTDVGTYSAPTIFSFDGYMRCIVGRYDGLFDGYIGPISVLELEDTVSDIMISSLSTNTSQSFIFPVTTTYTPTLLGLDFKIVKSITESSNLSLDNPFTLASTKTITESSNLSQVPIIDYHKTPSFNSSSNITTKIAWTLTKFLIMSGVPTVTATLISALVASAVATGTPLSPTLLYGISKTIIETSNFSIISKFFLEFLLSGTYIPTSFDAFIDSASFSGSGTPSTADILALHLIPSFQLTGILTNPSKLTLSDETFSMLGIISVEDIFPFQILLTQTVTGTPELTFKFILGTSDTTSILPNISSLKGAYEVIPFSNSITPTISKTLDFAPILSITITDNFSLASDIVLKLISFIASGSSSVTPLNVAAATATMTGVLSKTTAWTTSQSLSQSDSFTIEDFTSYTKTIEKTAVLTPTVIKVLDLFTTLSKTVPINIATEFVQTLLAVPTTIVTGTPSTDLKFFLEQIFTGQGVFSEISKFFITAILTSEMSNTVDVHFALKDSVSVSFEGIPLISVLEVFIGKLSLVLSDSTIKELTLEDTTIKGLVLEDNPVETLTLEDV